MTTSDQHYQEPRPRTLSPTASSAPSSARGRSRRELKFGLAIERLAPKAHRTRRGELNMPQITREYLVWRRLECGGAAIPAHELAPRGPNQTFTLSQIVEYGNWFRCIPRPVQCDLDGPKLGRHAHPLDRTVAQFAMLGKAFAGLKVESPFG